MLSFGNKRAREREKERLLEQRALKRSKIKPSGPGEGVEAKLKKREGRMLPVSILPPPPAPDVGRCHHGRDGTHNGKERGGRGERKAHM